MEQSADSDIDPAPASPDARPVDESMDAMDAMDQEALERVVFGANGYPRYILGTREPGLGSDNNNNDDPGDNNAVSYDRWYRARVCLARWHMREPSPSPIAAAAAAIAVDAVDVHAGHQAPAERFRHQRDWPVSGLALFDQMLGQMLGQILGQYRDAHLVVTLSGPASMLASPGVKPTEPEPDLAAPANLGVGDPLADALFGAGVGNSSSEAADSDSSLERALVLVGRALAFVAPPVGWLARRLGADRWAATIVDSCFAWHPHDNAPRVHVYADLEADPGANPGHPHPGSRPVRGFCTLERDGLVFHHHAAAAAVADRADNGHLELSLRTPERALVAFAFSGPMKTIELDAMVSRIDAAVARMLRFAADPWRADSPHLADHLTAEDELPELVAHGVPAMMPTHSRARLIATMRVGVCDDAQQRAILDVLRASFERGDIRDVLEQVGGIRVARDLLWAMDDTRDLELQALLQRAGIEYREGLGTEDR